MKIRPGTDWATAPRTSPSCDTWRSTSCKRTQPRDLCAGSSSAPAGTTPTSPVCSPYSEVRLPWEQAEKHVEAVRKALEALRQPWRRKCPATFVMEEAVAAWGAVGANVTFGIYEGQPMNGFVRLALCGINLNYSPDAIRKALTGDQPLALVPLKPRKVARTQPVP